VSGERPRVHIRARGMSRRTDPGARRRIPWHGLARRWRPCAYQLTTARAPSWRQARAGVAEVGQDVSRVGDGGVRDKVQRVLVEEGRHRPRVQPAVQQHGLRVGLLRRPPQPAPAQAPRLCLHPLQVGAQRAARCRLYVGCGCPVQGCAQPAAPRSAAGNRAVRACRCAGSRPRQPPRQPPRRPRGRALGNEERCRPRTALPGAARAHARRPRRTPWPAARAPRAACARSPAPPLAPRPPRCRARWAGLRQGRRCGRRRPPPWPRLRRAPRAAPPGAWRAPGPESLQHRVTGTVDRRHG